MIRLSLSIGLLLVFSGAGLAQSVGINTATPNASAALDVTSTTQGLLVPRMTTAQRTAIVSPAQGLLVFNTTTNCHEVFVAPMWRSLCGATPGCDYASTPTPASLSIAAGSAGNVNIGLSTVSGTPGNIATSLDNVTPAAPGITLAAITNNNMPPPVTQAATVNVNAATPAGTYTLTFRHNSACGTVRFTFVTVSVQTCNFLPVLTNTVFYFSHAGGSQSTSLDITLAGSVASTVTTSTVNAYPGITLNILNNGCSPTCTQTLQFTVAPGTTPGTYPYEFLHVSSCGTLRYSTARVWIGYRTCLEILTANPGSPNGNYVIDPDRLGPLPSMGCYCDMTTDGGGWTLVLNYMRLAGTNPGLLVKTTDLPLIGSTTLGIDESASATTWGHAAPALLNQIPFNTLRFYGITNHHPRVLHFKTVEPTLANYFRTGIGSVNIPNFINPANTVTLAGHNAFLPYATNSVFGSQGNFAMTEFPFWTSGLYHWGIRGQGSRWEVDNTPPGLGFHTYHQIWVR